MYVKVYIGFKIYYLQIQLLRSQSSLLVRVKSTSQGCTLIKRVCVCVCVCVGGGGGVVCAIV